ncbi:MAG: hypothetical protein HXY38_08830 [Chloroflexi bacterium]|nr:hypothetical protein [Chloroflexota bacterium]
MKQATSGIASFLQNPYGLLLVTTVVFNGILFGLGLDFRSPIVLGVCFVVLIFDAAAFYYIMDRLIFFFSQFVLPVQAEQDRNEIYTRVNNFDGERGPTLFVKNGRVIKHEGEMDKRGPGVIVLDTASAVVIQTDNEVIGAAGPGIRFTKANEYITREEGVDLRTQWQFIGPQVNEQTLFSLGQSSDAKKNPDSLARSQQATAGLTRDGFEVSATLSIKFRIKQGLDQKPASESGVTSQYGYNAAAVLNAVSREVVELVTADNKRIRMEWNRLPAHLVVNLWREYVRKFKLEDLFKAEGVNGLQTIQEMINRRVKRPTVVNLDDTGIPTGEAVPSLEFRQLEERGLEIMDVRIHNILFDAGIEEQIIKNWNTEWTKIAKREEEQLNEREKLMETTARVEAAKRFAKIATQKFDNPIAPPQDIFATLQALIEPIRETIIIESRANNQIEAETKKLDEISKWMLVQKLDSAMRSEEDKS